MNTVYLDNAATTSVHPEVLNAMLPYFTAHFGNPSSIYSLGRTTRLAIEESRKRVAELLGVKPAEIFFTSCGTESSNTVLRTAKDALHITRIISSPIEHHATLNTLKDLEKKGMLEVVYLNHLADGSVDKEYLDHLLKDHKPTLVSLMHANNESAHLLPIEEITTICKDRNAFFHSDMVQTIGHYNLNLKEIGLDFASASAHKFHGPKGIGLLYMKEDNKLNPLLTGGGQERNMRAGTENIAFIVGFAKALELALLQVEEDKKRIRALKDYCYQELKNNLDGDFRLNSSIDGLYTVLNISFPQNDKTEMIQMALDMKGICVSGGSACSSGALGGSHVISFLCKEPNVPLRISFSRENTKNDVDKLIFALKEILI